jgi:hypothetical protein
MMTHRSLLLSIPLLTMFLACDPKAEGGAVTVEEICDRIFEICPDHYGWSDTAACYDGFVGNADLGTECAMQEGYLVCMSDCVPIEECSEFQTCEAECWADNCE